MTQSPHHSLSDNSYRFKTNLPRLAYPLAGQTGRGAFRVGFASRSFLKFKHNSHALLHFINGERSVGALLWSDKRAVEIRQMM